MVFDAFAWAEYDGYFNIKLYKKNWYGGWDQVGYNYTRSQTSSVTTSTSPRGDNSMGDWFQVYWAMNWAGTTKTKFIISTRRLSSSAERRSFYS